MHVNKSDPDQLLHPSDLNNWFLILQYIIKGYSTRSGKIVSNCADVQAHPSLCYFIPIFTGHGKNNSSIPLEMINRKSILASDFTKTKLFRLQIRHLFFN